MTTTQPNTTNNIFNTDQLTTGVDQIGCVTYLAERIGYWPSYTTVQGTFWTDNYGMFHRKPRAKKFVFLCRRDAVIDFVPAEVK